MMTDHFIPPPSYYITVATYIAVFALVLSNIRYFPFSYWRVLGCIAVGGWVSGIFVLLQGIRDSLLNTSSTMVFFHLVSVIGILIVVTAIMIAFLKISEEPRNPDVC